MFETGSLSECQLSAAKRLELPGSFQNGRYGLTDGRKGPVGERQVLAGGEPKPKVSFQAGREAKVSSTSGWRAERPLPIGHCPGDAGWGRLNKLIRGCGSRKVYCRQDRARKSGGSFPSQTLAGRERLRLTFRRWRRPHHEIAELVRANCTRKQP